MEWTIGNIGQEIWQPSNPYANFAREGVPCCQVNVLLFIMPELHEPPKPLPNGTVGIGDGYALLRKWDKTDRLPDAEHIPAICKFLGADYPIPHIHRWAHAQLPNGQIVRSRWCEDCQPLHKLHISQNIKVHILIRDPNPMHWNSCSLHAMVKITWAKYNISHDWPLQLASVLGDLQTLQSSLHTPCLTRIYFPSHLMLCHHPLYWVNFK